ncbi:MAG TPA: SBBP repeat-containing protein [Gaiellaceae bacterium]|nr:SBBP repeat-containing protein [Gaiellaceae bacterium]
MRRFIAIGLGVVGACAVATSLTLMQWAGTAAPRGAQAVERPRPDYGLLPISFEPNRGQAQTGVRFVGHGAGYSVSLLSGDAVIGVGASKTAASLTLHLVGANHGVTATGLHRLPGTVNYFIGTNPRTWLRGIPTFAAVRYRGVYPGIDLDFHGSRGRLEYDFRLAPRADAGSIGLSFTGQHSMSFGSGGDLRLRLAGSAIRQLAPVAFQTVGGRRVLVSSRFVLRADGTVGIRVGTHDPKRALVIDPVISFSTLLGGSGNDNGQDVAVDSSGNAYVVGSTNGGFPISTGAYQSGYGCCGAAFVAKLNPSGTAVLYSTYLGEASGGSAIAVDSAGDAYVTGSFGTINGNPAYPTTPGAFQTTAGRPGNAFITKLDPTGSNLLYSTYLGGSGTCCYGDNGTAIAVDSAGDAYVAGATSSSDFPTTSGAIQSSLAGPAGDGNDRDGFVSKLNPAGSALLYSTYLGGDGGDGVSAIAVDSSGDAYVSGNTASSDFPVTPGAFQSSLTGPSDTFVAKINPTATALAYSTYLGGSGSDSAAGVAIDASGDAYASGSTSSSDFPVTAGAFQTVLVGGGNAFVSKLDPNGSHLVYSTYLGGSGDYRGTDGANRIAINAAGDAYVTGQTYSSDFPTTPDAFQTTLGPPGYGTTVNAFVSELNGAGSGLLYSTYLGGAGDAFGSGIALDTRGGVYVTGSTEGQNGPDFPTTPGAYQTTFGGSRFDAFVVKFGPTDTTPPTITLSHPADGEVLAPGSQEAASYSCNDDPGGSGIASCIGTLASGASIPTASTGTFTFVVTATDNAGNTASVTHTYYVAKTVSTMPQAMEGDLKLAAGTTLSVGYDFTMPGQHPQATVQVVDAQVAFAATCVNGPGGGTITVPMANASYVDPANGSSWIPSGDQTSPLVYQGATTIPNLCSGGLVRLQQGGAFSAAILSTDAANKVNIRWHYSGDGSAGGWSGTLSVVPG